MIWLTFLISFFTFVVGAYSGTKLRGHIPLRSPNNAVRLDNARTDLELEQIYRERRQEELNREHDEILAQKKLDEAREGYRQLTMGSENERALIMAQQIVRKVEYVEDDDDLSVVMEVLDKTVNDYISLKSVVKSSILTIRHRGAEPAKYILGACDDLAKAIA